MINLLIKVRESFLRLNDLLWNDSGNIFVIAICVPVDMFSSHCLNAFATREELLGHPYGTLVAPVRLRPVASLGLRLGLSTRDELIDAEILKILENS